MDRVDPQHLFGLLGRVDIEVNDEPPRYRCGPENAFGASFALALISWCGNKRRDIDEVAGTGFGHEFKRLSPTHAATCRARRR